MLTCTTRRNALLVGASAGYASGLPPQPQPDGCVDIPVPADVPVENGRLVLDDLRAAQGWTARVDDQEADQVVGPGVPWPT